MPEAKNVKTILERLAEARKIIRGTKVKKLGHNDYSKYDYFTPTIL